MILEQENRNYLQSYPGVIISGNSKENLERKPLCNHCPGFKISSSERKTSDSSLCTAPYSQTSFTQTPKKENAFPFSEDNRIYLHQPSGEGQALFNKCYFRKDSKRNLEMSNSLQDRSCKNETNCDTTAAGSDIFKNGNSNQDLPESNAPLTANNIENNLGTNYCDANSSTESRTCYSDCDSEVQSQFLERSHLLDLENDEIYNGLETVNDEIKKLNDSRQKINPTASTSQMPVHNYQVSIVVHLLLTGKI